MRDRVRRLLACLCVIACCPCCFPCYFCAIRSRKRRREREHQEAQMEHHRMGPRSPETVHPLRRGRRRRISIPYGLKRMADEKGTEEETDEDHGSEIVDEKKTSLPEYALTPSLSTTTEEGQVTNDQSQSLLFQKLPPEIRALIWRECVGNYDIHLIVNSNEKRVQHCKLFDGRGFLAEEANADEQIRLMEQSCVIPILQSCRRIYTETIPFVYTSNRFRLATPKILLSLSASTLTNRFNSISFLSIKYTPQLQHGLSFGPTWHDLRMWQRATDLLASMKGLRNLDLFFWDRSLYGSPGMWENLEDLLTMLKKIRQCRHYQVTLDQKDEVEGLRDKLGEDLPYALTFRLHDEGDRLFWLI